MQKLRTLLTRLARRPRFSCRTLMVAALIAVLALKFVLLPWRQSRLRESTLAMITDVGGLWADLATGAVEDRQVAEKRLLLRGPKVNDDFSRRAAERMYLFPELRQLDIAESTMSVGSVENLVRHSAAQRFVIYQENIGDAEIAKLRQIRAGIVVERKMPDPVATGLARLRVGQSALVALAIGPDQSSLLVGGGDGRLHRIGKDGGRRRSRIAAHTAWLFDASASPSGSMIATCGGDGFLRIWSSDALSLMCEIEAHQDDVHAVAWASEECLITAGDDCTIRSWRLAAASARPGAAPALQLHPLNDETLPVHDAAIPRLTSACLNQSACRVV